VAHVWRIAAMEARLYIRDIQSMIMSFLVPIFFILVFGSIFGRQDGFMEFFVPGLIGVTIMSTTLFSITVNQTDHRQIGLLKRLQLLPTSTLSVVVAQSLVRMLVVFLQVALALAVAIFVFKTKFTGALPPLFVSIVFGTLMFLALSFALGNFMRSTQASIAIANVLFIPMMFLSGAYFPLYMLPSFLQPILRALPLTPLVQVIRSAFVDGGSLTDNMSSTLWILGWLVVGLVTAVRTYRWAD
jgi:ABC-2 type transport system permease protein